MKTQGSLSIVVLVFVSTLSLSLVSASAQAVGEQYLSIQQTGAFAQSIYDALEVPELIEKPAGRLSGSDDERSFKVGQNVLCLKSKRQLAQGKKTTDYMCSTAFDKSGNSVSR